MTEMLTTQLQHALRRPATTDGDAGEPTHCSNAGPMALDRRQFLAVGVSASALLTSSAEVAADAVSDPLVDVNVSLSRWPLRRLPNDEPAALVARLRAQGVTQAWTGTLDGLLHKDLTAANSRLVDECQKFGEGTLLPFGSVSLTMPNAIAELRRCAKVHRMPGIRLHPNYHGYALDDPALEPFLREAVDLGLVVQLALLMEDARMMHPHWRLEPVNTAPLASLVERIPELRLVLLNALGVLRGADLLRVVNAGQTYVEHAMLEGVGGLENLWAEIPAERVLFGSHSPLFYFESAKLKLQESEATEGQIQAIRHQNAIRLLDGKPAS